MNVLWQRQNLNLIILHCCLKDQFLLQNLIFLFIALYNSIKPLNFLIFHFYFRKLFFNLVHVHLKNLFHIAFAGFQLIIGLLCLLFKVGNAFIVLRLDLCRYDFWLYLHINVDYLLLFFRFRLRIAWRHHFFRGFQDLHLVSEGYIIVFKLIFISLRLFLHIQLLVIKFRNLSS